jgi:hypothetical protein
MTTPPDNQLLRMDGWPGGVNNRVRETEQVVMRDGEAIPSSQFLRRALNVDLTAEGHPLRRKGYQLAEAGFAHSSWYCREQALFYVVVDGLLKVGRKPSELTPVADVNRYLPMSYAWFSDAVYFSNGADSGKYSTQIGLGVWPTDAYIPPKAEYRDGIVSDPYEYEPMKPGQLLATHKGRLYSAQDNILWFSEPMRPEHTRTATNFYKFAYTIEMVQPVNDGLYVADKTGVVFLSGTDPFDVTRVSVYPHPVVPKAFAQIPGEKFGVAFDYVPVWWSKDGVMLLGLPSGQIRQLTRDRLAVPEFGYGAVSLREREGISQVVSSLQKGGDENNMGATDTVVAEIRRNDITLNP